VVEERTADLQGVRHAHAVDLDEPVVGEPGLQVEVERPGQRVPLRSPGQVRLQGHERVEPAAPRPQLGAEQLPGEPERQMAAVLVEGAVARDRQVRQDRREAERPGEAR
jgi:hypothetical protein